MGCLIPTWCETVGDCLEHGVIVKRYCERCMKRMATSLLDLLADHGADYWLWDRREPCPTCGLGLIYMFTPGPTTPTQPMISTNPRDVARSARIRAEQDA